MAPHGCDHFLVGIHFKFIIKKKKKKKKKKDFFFIRLDVLI
jgi:hypothetical protein